MVDDDPRVRHALRTLIESSAGLSVSGEASSAPEAIRADDMLVPDVVLLDLLLPRAEEGLRALAELVERGRAVVVLSIRAALRAAALEAGAVTFVEKGGDPDVLLAALREAPDSNLL